MYTCTVWADTSWLFLQNLDLEEQILEMESRLQEQEQERGASRLMIWGMHLNVCVSECVCSRSRSRYLYSSSWSVCVCVCVCVFDKIMGQWQQNADEVEYDSCMRQSLVACGDYWIPGEAVKEECSQLWHGCTHEGFLRAWLWPCAYGFLRAWSWSCAYVRVCAVPCVCMCVWERGKECVCERERETRGEIFLFVQVLFTCVHGMCAGAWMVPMESCVCVCVCVYMRNIPNMHTPTKIRCHNVWNMNNDSVWKIETTAIWKTKIRTNVWETWTRWQCVKDRNNSIMKNKDKNWCVRNMNKMTVCER
jgi:hypothetical protein